MIKFKAYLPYIVCSLTVIACLWLVLSGVDTSIENWLYSLFWYHRGAFLSNIMIVFTTLGNSIGVIAVCVILLLIPKRRVQLYFSLPVALATLVSWLLNEGVKDLITRSRPDVVRVIKVTGYSFPSGHAMNNATLYLTILFLLLLYVKRKSLRRTAWILLPLLPFIIGISRVYLGAHYLTDIVAGWAFGSLIAYTTFLIVRRLNLKYLEREGTGNGNRSGNTLL